jgi:hypothetical protein
MLHEAFRSNDRDLDVRIWQHATGATEMVTMRVRVEQSSDRPISTIVAVQFKSSRRAFHRYQRIDDDDAPISFDDRHVRQVEATDLIDTVCERGPADDRVELGARGSGWLLAGTGR